MLLLGILSWCFLKLVVELWRDVCNVEKHLPKTTFDVLCKLFSGTGIDGRSVGSKRSLSGQTLQPPMIPNRKICLMRKQTVFPMDSCASSVWWGEAKLYSFRAGIWYAAETVPNLLNEKWPQSVLFVARISVIQCGHMVLKDFDPLKGILYQYRIWHEFCYLNTLEVTPAL